MAGKEEKLNAYKTATELAIKMAHAALASEGMPEPLAYLAVSGTISVMADLEIGCNTKYRRRKASCYVRAAYRLARVRSATWVMKETGGLTDEEYMVIRDDMEALSKMIWGLVKSINGSRDAAEPASSEGQPDSKEPANSKTKKVVK